MKNFSNIYLEYVTNKYMLFYAYSLHKWFFISLLYFNISCEPRKINALSFVTESDSTNLVFESSEAGHRIFVPGTHCSIIPPDSFKLSSIHDGLANSDGLFIRLTEFPSGNYYVSSTVFNRETFKKKGAVILDYQETVVDKYPARYASIPYDDTLDLQLMLFGDSTFYLLVTAMSPKDDERIKQQIKTALFTLIYDKKKKFDPFEVANFTVDNKLTKFTFFNYSGDVYTYKINPNKANKNLNIDTSKNITLIPLIPNIGKDNFPEYVKKRIREKGLSSKNTKKESYESINGYQTYQVEVSGSVDGVPTLIYIAYLVHGKQVVLMQGTATTDFPASLKEFKQFAQAIRIKP